MFGAFGWLAKTKEDNMTVKEVLENNRIRKIND